MKYNTFQNCFPTSRQERIKSNQRVKYILSGSQHFLLNDQISQSLAGRMLVLELHPFSYAELKQAAVLPNDPLEAMVLGGYPNVHARKIPADRFYPAYIQTYLERDVRQLTNVRDLSAFQTFLELLAGQAWTRTEPAPIGQSSGRDWTTLNNWLSVKAVFADPGGN